jgi:hypothetical protein
VANCLDPDFITELSGAEKKKEELSGSLCSITVHYCPRTYQGIGDGKEGQQWSRGSRRG